MGGQNPPQLRSGQTTKFTMAEGTKDGDILGVESEPTIVPFSNPRMPHLEFQDKSKLDEAFPSIEAVDEDMLPDLVEDEGMLKFGINVAKQVHEEMISTGRTRRIIEQATTQHVEGDKLSAIPTHNQRLLSSSKKMQTLVEEIARRECASDRCQSARN